jgi:hypothetical protein
MLKETAISQFGSKSFFAVVKGNTFKAASGATRVKASRVYCWSLDDLNPSSHRHLRRGFRSLRPNGDRRAH